MSKYERHAQNEEAGKVFNNYYNRQRNDWLHDDVYKHKYPNAVGQMLRRLYESGQIKNKNEFEVISNGLCDCQRQE